MTKPHTTLSEAVRALALPEHSARVESQNETGSMATVWMNMTHGLLRDTKIYTEDQVRALLSVAADLVEKAEGQEPVAWQYRAKLGNGDWSEWRAQIGEAYKAELVSNALYEVRNLYAQPTLAATQADEGREAQVLRRLLAYRVAGAKLYADDGELQDNTTWPHIDFRRDSVDTIENKLGDRTRAAFAKLTPEQIDAAMAPTTTRSE